MKQTTANYDEPWKEALTEYFEAFLCFFFPEVHQLIAAHSTPSPPDHYSQLRFLNLLNSDQLPKMRLN